LRAGNGLRRNQRKNFKERGTQEPCLLAVSQRGGSLLGDVNEEKIKREDNRLGEDLRGGGRRRGGAAFPAFSWKRIILSKKESVCRDTRESGRGRFLFSKNMRCHFRRRSGSHRSPPGLLSAAGDGGETHSHVTESKGPAKIKKKNLDKQGRRFQKGWMLLFAGTKGKKTRPEK